MGREVVIVSVARTPIGKFNGGLSHLPSFDMGAIVLQEVVRRAGMEMGVVDEVILGNIISTEPRGNPAREALIKAGFPIKVKGYTVNKNCGSALKAVNLATIMIKTEEGDILIAGGMESMSRAPHALYGARIGIGMGHAQMRDLLADGLEGMGLTAERLAEKYAISREEQDEFGLRSQQLACEAIKEGRFKEQIVSIQRETPKGIIVISQDESPKQGTTMESLSKLRPAFIENGTVTAGNSSTINDGAAAVLLMSAEKAKKLGVTPLARVVAWGEAGVDPDIMGIGPVPATRLALKKAGMTIEDMDLIELNEAFAAQSIAVIKELGMDLNKVNINGGAIALGHPVGATGAILIAKLIYELKRRGLKTGLATLCIGGGQGISTIIEAI